jgi:hypothetical protein
MDELKKAPSTKLPSSREIPNIKVACCRRSWSLEIGASLVLGAWDLELFAQHE